MNEIGWFFKILTGGDAPSGTYKKIDLNFKAKHIKVKPGTTLTLSFDGATDHAQIVAADGMQTFSDVNKGEIYYKGTGDAQITAWDGN